MNEKEIEQIIKPIDEISEQDPLKAIYLIDDSLKKYPQKELQTILTSLRNSLEHQIKRNNLMTKTNLGTLELINLLKNKKMDYFFMIAYQELKKRSDLQENAYEFQYFFNKEDFDSAGFQTLIYDLLHFAQIDFDYQMHEHKINPKKLGSFLENQNIKKMEKELLEIFEKDIAKYKIASQVFSAFLFQNWVNILLEKTQNEYEQIVNVTEVLLGSKDKTTLNENELKLYAVFAK
ncbi:Uncharacterised protein [Metamycoplasma arthritidis]|uniref:Uncharacterized protein n=1 Tax=Metamycoplasma arthritidis (strain 158L3-1) TaxID=243272 RepID=B3PNH5_META1|nr:hypothetical protein [Metamycoplasma arthritidis]ACF07577.1 hypothetical protein MARTH_orf858 [Metamycoplasma arthritidis 158L3-1]VEU79085.1 Uncharacterised protein [Metamycoplasma arthritidis]